MQKQKKEYLQRECNERQTNEKPEQDKEIMQNMEVDQMKGRPNWKKKFHWTVPKLLNQKQKTHI